MPEKEEPLFIPASPYQPPKRLFQPYQPSPQNREILNRAFQGASNIGRFAGESVLNPGSIFLSPLLKKAGLESVNLGGPKSFPLAPVAGLAADIISPLPGGETKATFKGLKGLSTKLVEKFRGLPTKITDQQFNTVLNQAKKEGIKATDEQLFRNSLVKEGNLIDLDKTAKNVQIRLVPLKATPVKSPRWSNIGEDFIGDGKYEEIVYESPIKTSAGQQHFSGRYGNVTYAGQKDQQFPNYYSHVRREVLPDNKGVKYLEWQSDLFQKENFERNLIKSEVLQKTDATKALKSLYDEASRGGKTDKEIFNSLKVARPDLMQNITDVNDFTKTIENLSQKSSLDENIFQKQKSQLEPYNQDTAAHLRTFREELKRNAKAGKEYILTPTGETAMKIEKLDKTRFQTGSPAHLITKEDIKEGLEIFEPGEEWIITQDLGEGKFSAIRSSLLERYKGVEKQKVVQDLIDDAKSVRPSYNHERFNVKGYDDSHFVYGLNEKDIPREARRLGLQVEKLDNLNTRDEFLNTTRPTVPGSWWKITGFKKLKNEPISAFGKSTIGTLVGGAAGLGAASLLTGTEQKRRDKIFKTEPLFIKQ